MGFAAATSMVGTGFGGTFFGTTFLATTFFGVIFGGSGFVSMRRLTLGTSSSNATSEFAEPSDVARAAISDGSNGFITCRPLRRLLVLRESGWVDDIASALLKVRREDNGLTRDSFADVGVASIGLGTDRRTICVGG